MGPAAFYRARMTLETLRTPDDRFQDLPGYAFAPRYLELEGMRMHYLDEGPRDAEHVYLCLHGEPTWAYLYRKMIPVFTAAGGRVIAPDFFGFGRSDKPVDDAVYTYAFHRRTLLAFIEAMELSSFTLVGQDWGGILGLSLPLDVPEKIARLIVMNTALPTGDVDPGPGFEAWKQFVATNPAFSVSGLMKRSTPGLTDAEAAAYEAPFPDARFMAGVRTFPAIVPVTTAMDGAAQSKKAAAWWATEWTGPTFMAVGVQDPVLGPPAMKALRRIIRGCPEPLMLEGAGHFVQEMGDVVAKAALEAFA